VPTRDPEEARLYKQKWWSKNKARKKKYNKKFRTTRRDHVISANAAYRARKLRAVPPMTQEEKDKIRGLYAHARHLTRATGVPHHVDHIHPLKHKLFCGLHNYANLQVIPAKLNVHKQNYIQLDILDGMSVNEQHHDD
jgi:hypothetical protein